ncbi:acyl-coenzyme A thioesterase 13-like [Centruroides sculpturatus]|uniref:acyl-coenzyme A thioesterase 13-like n=1 Tax=Centruroides sculpturatus TaxID=218467 RepID=UPI000C6EA460|nr:acyl-coenzyme A thioesterase 13-like [Centruroides sculpturatus]
MLICKEHENTNGLLHGGMTASLVDVVSTLILASSEKQVAGASVNMNISFLRPIKSGEEILIEAKLLQVGKTLAYSTVDIKNKKTAKLIATAHHTKYVG